MSDNNSFTSHFVELRSRLIKAIVFILIIFILSYTFAEHIYSFLVNPYAEAVKNDPITEWEKLNTLDCGKELSNITSCTVSSSKMTPLYLAR